MNNKARASATSTPLGQLHEQCLHRILGYQLAQATVVTDTVFEHRVGQPLGLRKVEYTILMLVLENPDSSPAQLSKALAVARPNMTAMLDRLEANGLLRRQQNENDRRGQHLRTTTAGASMVRRATQSLIEGESEAFSTLSAAEQMMLTELLHKLARARLHAGGARNPEQKPGPKTTPPRK